MNISVTKELEHSYLHLQETATESYEDMVLQYNEIAGILKSKIHWYGNVKQVQYVTDNLISIQEYACTTKMRGPFIHLLLESLFSIIAEARQYLLMEENFVLIPERSE